MPKSRTLLGDTFEEALADLVDDHMPGEGLANIISALELKLMELRERPENDDVE